MPLRALHCFERKLHSYAWQRSAWRRRSKPPTFQEQLLLLPALRPPCRAGKRCLCLMRVCPA